MEKKAPKLGSGKRFKAMANKMAREGMEDPDAAAAAVGRAKYGNKKMIAMAKAGKKRREK